MKLSEQGYILIRTYEGIRNKSYLDQRGIPTIGIGFTHINGKPVTLGMFLTNQQIEDEFMVQIVSYEECINNNIKSDINQNMFDSLCSICFNIGTHAFSTSTLCRMVNEDPNNKENISKAFQMFDKVNGQTDKGLLNRRNAEISNYFKL